jgi:hypothetical protein
MGYTQEGIGYQGTDTSKQAALSNVDSKLSIRDQVHELLSSSKIPLSTEQIATRLNKPYVSVQPRLSELSNANMVKDSGHRGTTQWGKSCILWSVKEDK